MTTEPADASLSSSIAAIRARLAALDAAKAGGTLDDVSYDAARREAERQLGAAVLAAPVTPAASPVSSSIAPSIAPSIALPSSKTSWRLVAGVVAFVALLAIGGYAFTGSPSLAGLGKPPVAPPAATEAAADGNASADQQVGLQQIAEMVDRLAVRLKEKPDDAEGWKMLARSYTVLNRYGESLPAYEHAVALQPQDAGLLADYADATAAADGGKPSAASTALIERALAADPKQPKALALAGTVAFERADYPTAVRYWQKIADELPPGGEFHQQVMANIDEARRRGGLGASTPRAAPGPTATPSAPGHEALTGTVSLDPALAASASPDDTVFVLARPESGRMPLAVFRAKVKDLPLRFRLDDGMAMTPTMKISDMKQVIVAARVSKSGNAITQPGDLSGEIGPVAPGSTDLKIVIGKVATAR